MKNITTFINEQMVNEAHVDSRFNQVEKQIGKYIETYVKQMPDEGFFNEKDYYTKKLEDAYQVVGDSFYGTDGLVEFKTKTGNIGQIRLQLRPGMGGAYRERKPHIIVSVNINNWWDDFDMETPQGVKSCITALSK